MKHLSLSNAAINWQAVFDEIKRSGEPVALLWDDRLCGVLLPSPDAERTLRRLADEALARSEQRQAAPDTAGAPAGLPTYLDLLRDDPTLVPAIEGQPLEFMTMSNTSFVDPQQMYTFMDPRDGTAYVYRADELQQAIGRPFSNVEFVPASPREYVKGQKSRVEGRRS